MFAATLVFNPLTYTILSNIGWRLTYAVYAAAILVTGVPAAVIFKSKEDDDSDSELQTTYEEFDNKPAPITRRTKYLMGGIWLVASTLKSIAYYTPFVTLVSPRLDILNYPQKDGYFDF